MIKVYCNKCGRELATGNHRIVRMVISPISCHGEIKLEFCEKCLREIIGEDEYCKLKEREEERKRKSEERRKERSKNND